MKKKIKDLEPGQWFTAPNKKPGRIFELKKPCLGHDEPSYIHVFSFKPNEVGVQGLVSPDMEVEIFPESPYQKRVIKRIYRLFLSKILENKIWRIYFSDGTTPDQTKEAATDVDRFFQIEKKEFKKRVGMEVKNA